MNKDNKKLTLRVEKGTNYAQTEIGDALEQLRQMCYLLDLDYDDTVKLGARRYNEKWY